MKIETLKRFGLPEQLISRWVGDNIRTLLPIQADAVTRHGLLGGQSLIISGPGTSGKTFCGELAAASKAVSRGKAVFLVPLKAIAQEKYQVFEKRYGPLGLKIRLATRDHTMHDTDIARRNFDVAILIYEKFNSLSAADISIIKNSSCFVLDEFQMIADPKRGPELELVILKIRTFNAAAQIIILMGGGSSPRKISEWLNLPVLSERQRPVDLRLGVLHRGTFRFRGCNDLSEGDEHWLSQIDDAGDNPMSAQNLAAVKHLALQGEQILIFTSTRRNAIALAEYLASHLELPPAREAHAMLADGPQSLQNESLGRCLLGGVAYHHAELDENQRQVVEESFRNGGIRILASTSTLAWGVNLPAKNVFIETMKYGGQRSPHNGLMLEPMTNVDFQQAAGRAGRLGCIESDGGRTFGRAIMTASTPFEKEILWDKYIYAPSEDPVSALSAGDLPDMILRMISCGAALKPDHIDNCCARLYGSCDTNLSNNISRTVNDALVYLEKNSFVTIKNWGKVETTTLGQAVSSCGLRVESAVKIREMISANLIADPLEWILAATDLDEWTENSSNYYWPQSATDALLSRVNDAAENNNLQDSKMLADLIVNSDDAASRARMAAFLFALDWRDDIPTTELEMTYNRGAGGLKRDGQTLAWILRSVERICRASHGPGDRESSDALLNLALQLSHGVNKEMLPLAQELNLDREFIRRLYQSGFVSLEHLLESERGDLLAILPRPVIEKIESWRKNKLAEKARYFETLAKAAEPDTKSIRTETNSNSRDAKIVFTGKNQKQRMEVLIDGHSIYLQPRLYSYFQKLYWASKGNDSWVNRDTLDAGTNQAKYISKLRKILNDSRTGIDIAASGRGSYRMVFAPT